jgi:hypothetical protein
VREASPFKIRSQSSICREPLIAARIDFNARVAKLADAQDLGSCTLIGVGVRPPPLAFF